MFMNVWFYIFWLVFSIIPLSVLIAQIPTIKWKIISCLCALVITFGVVVLMWKNAENAVDRWNNGICECGGTYEFSGASNYRTSKYFYYTCDTCGHTEEFSQIMK